MVVAFNHPIRQDDEWLNEPDELERIERLLEQLEDETDPVIASAHAVGRIARSQAFTEGNKRTALLVGRWILDRNGIDGLGVIPEQDTELGGLLLSAARGVDEDDKITQLFESRR
jgi:prophage maintenance system killer protein